MLEQNKKMDEKQQNMDNLQGVVKTGKATKNVYAEMCDVEDSIKEIQNFIESAPEYNGYPE